MRYYVCAVRDRAADVFGQPIFAPSKGVAFRSFSDEINRSDPNNQMNKHPEDFDLYFLGMYDDNVGKFSECPDQPEMLAVGKDLVMSRN